MKTSSLFLRVLQFTEYLGLLQLVPLLLHLAHALRIAGHDPILRCCLQSLALPLCLVCQPFYTGSDRRASCGLSFRAFTRSSSEEREGPLLPPRPGR